MLLLLVDLSSCLDDGMQLRLKNFWTPKPLKVRFISIISYRFPGCQRRRRR
jgi:hypothetical protein